MSGLTNLVKSRDKEKYLYSGYRIAFEWNFGNDYARNITIFGVDTSLSSHADNLENNFLVPGEGDTFGINGSFGAPEKKNKLILVKQTQNFAWVYIIMLIICICLLKEKNYWSLKLTMKMLTFQHNYLGSISNRFSAAEFREVSLNENVHDFSIDYNSVNKSDILLIHKYLMQRIT